MAPLSHTAKRPVVLITGASSGLGAGMAARFAQDGCDLALCARRTDRLETLRAGILKATPAARVEIAALNVTDYAQVFTQFHAFKDLFGQLDRVVVNAGIGTGAPVGKGGFAQNLALVETNFTAALAQAEAALEIFRAQEFGHLVFISSVTAMRGMRSSMTCYSASKAAVAHLAEGIRADVMRKPRIKVSTIFPGYIRSEMNADQPRSRTPFIIDTDQGCELLVKAIKSGRSTAYVPFWPWRPMGLLMRALPLSWVTKLI